MQCYHWWGLCFLPRWLRQLQYKYDIFCFVFYLIFLDAPRYVNVSVYNIYNQTCNGVVTSYQFFALDSCIPQNPSHNTFSLKISLSNAVCTSNHHLKFNSNFIQTTCSISGIWLAVMKWQMDHFMLQKEYATGMTTTSLMAPWNLHMLARPSMPPSRFLLIPSVLQHTLTAIVRQILFIFTYFCLQPIITSSRWSFAPRMHVSPIISAIPPWCTPAAIPIRYTRLLLLHKSNLSTARI